MSAQPYTKEDLALGEQIVRELHGLRGYDAWAERIAKAIAARHAASPSPPVPGVTEEMVEDIIRGCREAGPCDTLADGDLRTYYAGYNLTALARAITAALSTRSASQLENREEADAAAMGTTDDRR